MGNPPQMPNKPQPIPPKDPPPEPCNDAPLEEEAPKQE